MIAWVLKIIGSRALWYGGAALVALITGTLWFTTNYTDKAEAEAKIESLTTEVNSLKGRIETNREILKDQIKKNNELNRHMDGWREYFRSIKDEEAKDWRNTPVPESISRGLHNFGKGAMLPDNTDTSGDSVPE